MGKVKRQRMPEHYDSLDAPVFVWHKVHETQDLTWLLVKKKNVPKSIIKKLSAAWEKIFDDYLKEFGLSEQFINIKKKEISIAKRKMNLILLGDRTELTWIEIEEEELAAMRQDIGKGTFGQSKIAIEARWKFQINLKTTSIYEFYDYLRNLK